MARHLRATASPFLPHLEPKSKLSSRPCPPCPQPARALDRQTSPAYPAPTLSSQSPKATQPTRLGPIRPGGCIRGQARPGARMFAGTGPFPACRRGDGRAGRWNWCWLTGYIFDTFNELVQTFHEEGLARPCYCRPALVSASCSRGMCRPRQWPHHTQDWGVGLRHCALPPPFLGQNGLDAYSVAAICARRRSVIYTCCSN